MSDVFISYSRRDIAFARLLHQALKEQHLEPWIDWQDIPPSADWLAEVYQAIEQSDTVVFIISPTSIDSEICGKEIAHAVKNNKRLIPLVVADVDPRQVSPSLAALNWIFFRESDDFKAAFARLQQAIETDQALVKEHTRLQNRALEWERKGRERSYLLQGHDLEQAERWLAEAAGKEPAPTGLHTQYLLASRQASTRRQRTTLTAVLVALAITVGLGALAWALRNQAEYNADQRARAEATAVAEALARATSQAQAEAASTRAVEQQQLAEAASTVAVEQRDEAQRQAALALSGGLAAQSRAQIEDRLDVALLLGAEAYAAADTFQARDALYAALAYNPQLGHLLHAAGRISGLAFSADGKLLAAGSCAEIDSDRNCVAGELRVWDVASGRLLGEPQRAQAGWINALAFSPDGKMLATGSGDKTVLLWDVATLKTVGQPLTGHAQFVTSLVFSPDGKTLAAGSCFSQSLPDGRCDGGDVLLWDVATGKMLARPFEPGTGYAAGLAFSPDGKMLVASGCAQTDPAKYDQCVAGAVRLWDVTAGQPVSPGLAAHSAAVMSVAFNTDGTLLATGSGDKAIRVWHWPGLEPAGKPITTSKDVAFLAFQPDGHTLIASGALGKEISFWDSAAGSSAGTALASPALLQSVAASPDGQWVAAGSCGQYDASGFVCMQGDVRVLSTRGPVTLGRSVIRRDYAAGQGRYDVLTAISPDLSRAATVWSAGDEQSVTLWDTGAGEVVHTVPVPDDVPWAMAFSPDGTQLAWGSCGARDPEFQALCTQGAVWLAGGVAGEVLGEPLAGHGSWITSLAWTPDGQTLASGSMDGSLILWDAATRQMRGGPWQGPAWGLYALEFSPDGKTLATGGCLRFSDHCMHSEIALWDLTAQEPISRALPGPAAGTSGLGREINGLAFSPDGRTLAAATSEGILLWDVAGGQLLGEPIVAAHGAGAVAFSPDGRTLAYGGDDAVFLWDLARGQAVGMPYQVTVGGVEVLRFSADGRVLASDGPRGGVFLWDVDPSAWQARACGIASRNLTRDEWAMYFVDVAYRETCGGG